MQAYSYMGASGLTFILWVRYARTLGLCKKAATVKEENGGSRQVIFQSNFV